MKPLELIGVLLAACGLALSIALSFNETENAVEVGAVNHVSQQKEIDRLAQRIDTIESNTRVSDQLNKLTNEVVALRVQVEQLTKERRRP